MDTNLYGYVLNDPVNLTDAAGLAPFDNQCDRTVPFKPEDTCEQFKENRKYDCPPGQSCDVDGVYPPSGGNPIKICSGCESKCVDGQLVVTCPGPLARLCQLIEGGPVPDDWWDDHPDWPKPADSSAPWPGGSP